MHIQAVSVRAARLEPPPHSGGHQPAGQPLHADGRIRGGDPAPVSGGPVTVTPSGSPGWTSWSGPTVDGGTDPGGFGFGVMSDGSYGGRIDRLKITPESNHTVVRNATLVWAAARTWTSGRGPRNRVR